MSMLYLSLQFWFPFNLSNDSIISKENDGSVPATDMDPEYFHDEDDESTSSEHSCMQDIDD